MTNTDSADSRSYQAIPIYDPRARRRKIPFYECVLETSDIMAFTYLFYVAIHFLTTTQIGNISSYDTIVKMADLMIFAINVIVFLRDFFPSRKWFLISVLLLAAGLPIALGSGLMFRTALLLLFIVNGTKVNYRDLFIKYVILMSFLLAATILLERFGILSYDYRVDDTRVRLYLGFTATTYSPNYLYHIVLVYIASKLKKITVKETVIILAANYYLYRCTHTRAVFYFLILMLGILWFEKLVPFRNHSRIIETLVTFFMPALAILFYFLAFQYTERNALLVKLDKLLTSRINLAHTALTTYPLNLFGHEIEWQIGRFGIERTTDYFYVDSSYVNAGLVFGIPLLIFVIVGFSLLMRMAYKRRKFYLLTALMFLALHCFSDPQLFDLKYDPFLLMIGFVFMQYRWVFVKKKAL